MHGVLLPQSDKISISDRLKGVYLNLIARARAFLVLVVAPGLLVAIYYGLIASNQYESSADFVVRKADASKPGTDVGQLLGFSIGTSATTSDGFVVQQYLLSHDAVTRLRKENDLVGVFSPPGADLFSRLWSSNPTPERLLKFYRAHVSIQQDDLTGITHLSVRTFRPQDSAAIANKLLHMGEQQVNAINQRTFNDDVASAQRNYDTASHRLAEVQAELTAYRRAHGDIDPADTGKAQVTMVTGLTSNLVVARARLNAIASTVGRNSPQYRAMERQVDTLTAQVNGQISKISGPERSVATRLSDYEQLAIRRQELAQLFSTADAQLQQARAESKRKQLYLIRVVEPNVPVKSEYPERGKIILTVFAALTLAYAIGWLLWAGVKEHAA